MAQLKLKNRNRPEFIDFVLNILQQLLIAMAFILFMSFLQVSVADITMSVSSHIVPMSQESSYLSPIAGLVCLLASFLIRKVLFINKARRERKKQITTRKQLKSSVEYLG